MRHRDQATKLTRKSVNDKPQEAADFLKNKLFSKIQTNQKLETEIETNKTERGKNKTTNKFCKRMVWQSLKKALKEFFKNILLRIFSMPTGAVFDAIIWRINKTKAK